MILPIAFAALFSARQFAIDRFDARLACAETPGSLSRFVGYPSGAEQNQFTPNCSFWAKGVDFSCASPWNSCGGRLRAGTLISRRHLVLASHFPLGAGTRIVFVGEDGGACPCWIDKTKTVTGTDIMVASLDAEVTPNIKPARLLPDDYRPYISDGDGLPVITLDQDEQGLPGELVSLPTNKVRFARIASGSPGGQSILEIPCYGKARESTQAKRRDMSKTLGPYASGNPAFLLVGNKAILIYCISGSGFGTGPLLHLYKREIQATMDELCPGYKLQEFDFRKIGSGADRADDE